MPKNAANPTSDADIRAAQFQTNLEAALQKHEQGHVKAAHHDYESLLVQQPENAGLLHANAIALLQLDRVDDALPFAEKAVSLVPEAPTFLNTLGLMYRNTLRHEEAIECFEKALAQTPDYAEAWNNIGLVYGDLGQRPKAITYFKKAYALNPNHQEIALNLAHALRDEANYTEAHALYKKLVELNPESVRHNFNYALILHAMDDFEQAAKYLRKVIEIDPHESGARHLLAATSGELNVDQVPDKYISDLFDTYADNFDYHLAALQYKVPELLSQKIPLNVAPQTPAGDWALLDLGCGTGACGLQFNNLCTRMLGLDLSRKMIRKAKSHGVYDELFVEGIDAFYARNTEAFDLIVAADVLVYIGALENFMAESAKALKSGGLLTFSTEVCTAEEGRFTLRNTGRFAHSDPYVLQLAQANGLTLAENDDINVRNGNAKPIPGKLYILKK